MQSVVRQRVFHAHTAVCNQFEAASGSWERIFPTEFVYFCWCYDLGQKKNIYLLGFSTVPAKKYQPYTFFCENEQKLIEELHLFTKKFKICTLDRDIVKYHIFN